MLLTEKSVRCIQSGKHCFLFFSFFFWLMLLMVQKLPAWPQSVSLAKTPASFCPKLCGRCGSGRLQALQTGARQGGSARLFILFPHEKARGAQQPLVGDRSELLHWAGRHGREVLVQFPLRACHVWSWSVCCLFAWPCKSLATAAIDSSTLIHLLPLWMQSKLWWKDGWKYGWIALVWVSPKHFLSNTRKKAMWVVLGPVKRVSKHI